MIGRWPRRLAVACAALVLLLLAARQGVMRYGAHRLERAKAALVQRIGPLDPASLRLPEVADEDNAAYWILQAAEAAGLNRVDRDAELGGIARPARLWSAEERARWAALVERNGRALELLERAATAPGSTFNIAYEEGVDAELPDFMVVLQTARLAEAAAKSAFLAGDEEGLLTALRALDGISAALCREPILLTALLSGGVERMSLRVVADYLDAGYPMGAVLANLRESLARDRCEDSLDRSFRGELLAFHDQVSHPILDGRGRPWADTSEPLSATLLREFWFVTLHDLGVAAYVEAKLRDLDSLDVTWTEYASLHESGVLKPFGPRIVVAVYDLMTPNLIELVGRAKGMDTSRRLAAAALDVATQRLASGAFPASLELFETPYAGEVPVYTVHGNWAEVAAPESERLYNERQPPPNEQSRIAFRFRIPAPAPPQ